MHERGDYALRCDQNAEDCFCGIATIGERGQIVIPAEARKKLGVVPGEKLLVMFHPSEQGLMLFKIDAMRQFMTSFLEGLNKITENTVGEKDGESDPVS